MTSRSLQVIVVLALGVSLGYLAAANRSAVSDASEGPHVDAPTLAAAATTNPPQELLLAQATPKASSPAPTNGKKPNILFIMGDDVGWFNIGAYHRGIMAGRTQGPS